MHGTVLPVLRKQDFNYSFLIGSTNEFIVANAVSIARYNRIGFSARVHSAVIAGPSGSGFRFVIRGVNPSEEDGRDFVLSSDLGQTPMLGSSTSGPLLADLNAVIVDPQVPFVRVVLVATSTATGATGAGLYAQLSADLKMWLA